MTSAPPPPAGWKQQIVVPTSQQQAQDVVLGYLRKTLQGLPAGTTLDATGYGATNTPPCKDDIANPPVSLTTIGDLKPPAGTDPNSLVAQTGEMWKSWGWYVFERDDFRKPNRFGYSPDGYTLQIKAKAQAGFPPSLEGVSPCFPGDLAKDRSPFPTVITAE